MRLRVILDLDGDFRAIQGVTEVYDDQGDRQTTRVAGIPLAYTDPAMALAYLLDGLAQLEEQGRLFPEPF